MDFNILPPELLNIILNFHHCENCYDENVLCLKCYVKCDCEYCKICVALTKKYDLMEVARKLIDLKNISSVVCTCEKCNIYLPFVYHHKLKN
jgi:hypothetical protein